jgi:hypothetical protein
MLSRDGTGELIYTCSDGSNIRQSLKRYQIRGPVELWAAKGFTTGQLHQLSASKCQAATIYSGSESMTIKYPCALVHLTVAFSIQSTSNSEKGRFLRLQPTSVLITYPDGLQKFEVQQNRLVPTSPFQPFQSPSKPPPHTSRIFDRHLPLMRPG